MDVFLMLQRLWRHKLALACVGLLAIGAAVLTTHRVGLAPPKLESRHLEYGAANTELLVDTEVSSLADADVPIVPLAQRAAIFAEFLKSERVRDDIGRRTGIPANQIVLRTEAVSAAAEPRQPNAEERSTQLVARGQVRRLSFRSERDSPVVRVYVQAATAAEARELADASAASVSTYVAEFQKDAKVASTDRVVVTQLAEATGGTVNEGANRTFAAIALLAVLVLGCVLILLVDNVARTRRMQRAADTVLGRPDDNGFQERANRSSVDQTSTHA